MPFCPECKYEYVEGVTVCRDCDVALVEKIIDHEDAEEEHTWVLLKTFPGGVFAEMAKDALANNNIPCLIRKDAISTAYGIQGTGIGGLTTAVLVPEKNLDESRGIIETLAS